MAELKLYFWTLFFGTFILEDLALASAIMLLENGKMSFLAAFLACFLGISVGDIGLYLIGSIISKKSFKSSWGRFQKWQIRLQEIRDASRKMELMDFAVVASRFIPGTRLPTYLSAGFLRYSFFRFCCLTIGSVLIWVLGVFWFGQGLREVFGQHWILTLVFFFFGLGVFKTLLSAISDPWERKALMHSWRRWLYFEFWPPLLFYLPIVPIYIYLWIRHRSPLMPFYASPHLSHGGLIGESKWELLKHLSASDPSTLITIKLPVGLSLEEVKVQAQRAGLNYPYIIKPDVGQRGFAVRILRNDLDLLKYLGECDFEVILQELSPFPCEAGIFYVRRPQQHQGFLFSITDKKFPVVRGDGVTKLGDLILKDKRARIIAKTYFERLRERLNEIPKSGEVVVLAECGNHCQGAQFFNGEDLISTELTAVIDQRARQIPDFFFGRFDIRYESPELLRQGLHFEIVEINAAGAEATHIWDPGTRLWQAYVTLFQQWSLLFEIGADQKKNQGDRYQIDLLGFFKEVFKINRRKTKLSVSS